jgi:hypothetical protein
MHVFEYILDKTSCLFRFNDYPFGEKAYSVIGLNLKTSPRDTWESVRRRFHRFSRLFSVGRGFRNAVAVEETS